MHTSKGLLDKLFADETAAFIWWVPSMKEDYKHRVAVMDKFHRVKNEQLQADYVNRNGGNGEGGKGDEGDEGAEGAEGAEGVEGAEIAEGADDSEGDSDDGGHITLTDERVRDDAEGHAVHAAAAAVIDAENLERAEQARIMEDALLTQRALLEATSQYGRLYKKSKRSQEAEASNKKQ